MRNKLEALYKNHTWDIADLPTGVRPISCKWVYRVKMNSDGFINKFKVRLVAKGFFQIHGIDYNDSFTPVAKVVTVRILIAHVVNKGQEIHQMDTNNVFLHGHLEEDIYLKPLQGLKVPKGSVCKLNKVRYGLKQAPRQWYPEFSTKITQFGFIQSTFHHYLFVFNKKGIFLILIVYVDDILLTRNNISKIQAVKGFLNCEFTIKDLGEIDCFLGIQILHTKEGIWISQQKYICDILQEANMLDTKPVDTPLPTGCKITQSDGSALSNSSKYRRLVGRLLYLTMTRPNIMFAIQQLSQFMAKPIDHNWKLGLRILRYLQGTKQLQLFFRSSIEPRRTTYSNSDWGCCLNSKKSIFGYCIYYGDCLISWKTKKQATVLGHLPKQSTGPQPWQSMRFSEFPMFYQICRLP